MNQLQVISVYQSMLKVKTKAFSKVDIRSQTSEKIVNIGFKDGDYVNEGEVICKLDSGERLANFKRAEIGFNSAKELSKKGLSSQSSLVAAETTFEQARIALERTNIAAPFGGFVDNLAKEGATSSKWTDLCLTGFSFTFENRWKCF